MALHFKSGLFSYAIVCFNFVRKNRYNHQTFYIEISLINSDDHDSVMTSPMIPLLTYVL